MGAETAGEKSVSVCDLNDVVTGQSATIERAAHRADPDVDVLLGVGDDDRLAGRTARCVQAHDLRKRHRKKSEGIMVAQIRFLHKGKFSQILQTPDIVGSQIALLHTVAEKFHVIVSMTDDTL